MLTVIFTMCFMAIRQIPVSDQFQTIAQTIITFFFGTKVGEVMAQNRTVAPTVG